MRRVAPLTQYAAGCECFPPCNDARKLSDHGGIIEHTVADWTAITGIVVSDVVGPAGGAWWGARRARRDHEYARVLTDRTELRAIFDEAEQAMRVGERMASMVHDLLLPQIRGSAQLGEFHEALRSVDLQVGRLALRCGAGAPVASAYREAFDALVRVEDALNTQKPSVIYDEADLATRRAGVQVAAGLVIAAHKRFLASAHELVASQVAPR